MDAQEVEVSINEKIADPVSGLPLRRGITGGILNGEAGRPVIRGSRSNKEVPGAVLSPERSTELQAALRAIRMAEVEGSGPGVIGGRPYGL